MKRLLCLLVLLALRCPVVPPLLFVSTASAGVQGAGDERLHRRLGHVHVPFIANVGQADPAVAFYAQTFAGSVYVTHDGQIVYSLSPPASPRTRRPRAVSRRQHEFRGALTERFLGGSPRPRAGARTRTEVSFFLGSDPRKWRSGLPSYDWVDLGEVWAGVEVSLRSHGDSVEKLFTLAPGASAEQIRVQLGGAEELRTGTSGTLLALTELGEVRLTSPIAYQEKDGKRLPVAVAYDLHGNEYGFRLGAYNPVLPVVIDPLLQSTFLGGPSDALVHHIAIHPLTGDVFVAGATGNGFPGTAGGAQPVGNGAFVARLNAGLTRLIQATFVGGSRYQEAHSLAIAASGEVLVAGFTNSTDFPATAGGAQPALRGGADAFVARLNPTLTALLQATYLGGSRDEDDIAMTLHPVSGEVLLAGTTFSTDLPGTVGGAQPVHGGGGEDAFVARLNPTLTALLQATYAGGSGSDGFPAVAVHPLNGEIFLAGQTDSRDFPRTAGGAQPIQRGRNSFVARFTPDLRALSQATYIGGSRIDGAVDLVVHPASGDILLAGVTSSPDFPGITGGAQPVIGGFSDAFIARFNPSLRVLLQATYLGGSQIDTAFNVAVLPGSGDILVEGVTTSPDFPGTAGGAQPMFGGGSSDAYAARLSSDLTRLWQATYLGGSSLDHPLAAAIHPWTGDVYVAGYTSSSDFPKTAGGAQETRRTVFNDAFVARLTGDLSAAGQAGANIPTLSWPALLTLAMLLASVGAFLLKRAG